MNNIDSNRYFRINQTANQWTFEPSSKKPSSADQILSSIDESKDSFASDARVVECTTKIFDQYQSKYKQSWRCLFDRIITYKGILKQVVTFFGFKFSLPVDRVTATHQRIRNHFLPPSFDRASLDNPFPKLKTYIEKDEPGFKEVLKELLATPHYFLDDYANYLATEWKVSPKKRAVEIFLKRMLYTHTQMVEPNPHIRETCLSLLSKFIDKTGSESPFLGEYGYPFKAVKSALKKHGISLSLSEIDIIVKNGYGADIRTLPSQITNLCNKEEYTINVRTLTRSYFDEFLDNRGFDIQFCLKNNVSVVKKLLEWDLALQSPVMPFLECINQHPTPQAVLLAWALKIDKSALSEWSQQVQEPSSIVDTSVQNNALLKLYGSQEIFNREMGRTIQLAADGIKKKAWGFVELALFAGYRRMMIAKWQDQVDTRSKKEGWSAHHYFGFPRGGPHLFSSGSNDIQSKKLTLAPNTYLTDVYKPLAMRLVQLNNNLKLNSRLKFPSDESMPTYFYSSEIVPDRNAVRYKHAQRYRFEPLGVFYIKIDGKAIPLSCFAKHAEKDYYAILHTSGEYAEVLTQECQKRYQSALQEEDIGKLIVKLGGLFWLICQAKLWLRGDPSIAEMIVRSVLLSKGWKAPIWREGVLPWEEASAYIDGDEFGNNFASFFAGGLASFEQTN